MPAVGRDTFLWGHPYMLGQEWIYSLTYFPFLINVSDSCWPRRHCLTAALRAVPLNISFLATQKPWCRAWDSLCSIWDVALNFPGDLWQIVYLPHLWGGGNHPSLPQFWPICISLYHVCCISSCVACGEDCLVFFLQACLQWQWAMMKILFSGTWYVKVYFTWAMTLDYNGNKYFR